MFATRVGLVPLPAVRVAKRSMAAHPTVVVGTTRRGVSFGILDARPKKRLLAAVGPIAKVNMLVCECAYLTKKTFGEVGEMGAFKGLRSTCMIVKRSTHKIMLL